MSDHRLIVADAVWSTLAALDFEPEVELIVRIEPTIRAEDAVRAAVGVAMARFEPGVAGACLVAYAVDGIAVWIGEDPVDISAVVRAIAEELGAAGIEGILDVPDVQGGAAGTSPTAGLRRFGGEPIPPSVELIECRVRLKGDTARQGGDGPWRLMPAVDSVRGALDAIARHCVADSHGAELFLFSEFAWFRIDRVSSVRTHLERACRVSPHGAFLVLVALRTDGGFSAGTIDLRYARASLVTGGDEIPDHWRSALRHLRDQLVAAAPWASYGFVKRGMNWSAVYIGQSLATDWRPDGRFDRLALGDVPFEHYRAPDVFGVQLLGDGYRELPARLRGFHASPGPSNSTIVEADDLAAWFSEPLPQVAALESARVELEDILVTDDEIRAVRLAP